MLAVRHTTPKRALSHLRRLQREGEAILASRDLLHEFDPFRWDVRLFEYLRRISADRSALDEVVFRGRPVLPLHHPPPRPQPTPHELDRKVRKDISRHLTILAHYIEQLEAIVDDKSTQHEKT
jgi:hypothetical protein